MGKPQQQCLFFSGRFIVCLFLVGSCQSFNPQDIEIPEYPDLMEVYKVQYQALGGKTLEKKVRLGLENESMVMDMDSIQWKNELGFFNEINPQKPEFIGVYQVIERVGELDLQLKEGEKSALKKLKLFSDEGELKKINATTHEDKDLFTHHQEIEVIFENGLIESWTILGFQKMMFGDTVRFGIEGKVNERSVNPASGQQM